MGKSKFKIKLILFAGVLITTGLIFAHKNEIISEPGAESENQPAQGIKTTFHQLVPFSADFFVRSKTRMPASIAPPLGRALSEQANFRANRANSIPEAVKNKFLFSNLAYGLELSGWKTVSNVIAVPIRSDSKETSGSLWRVNHHDLILSEDSFHDLRGKQIVFNANRDRVGVVSGTLVIELFNTHTESALIAEYQLKVESFAEGINTLFVSTLSPTALDELKVKLLKDSRVKRVEVEILEDIHKRQ